MIQIKKGSIALLLVGATLFSVSCKNEKAENEKVVITDTTIIEKHTDTINGVSDTIRTTKTTTRIIGTARPNPAKKGKKGIVKADFSSVIVPNEKIVIEMDKDGIYNKADIMPTYPGGEKALRKFVENNIVYPEAAIEDGVEGTVLVIFAIDEMGNIYTPKLKNDVVGYGLDEEALRVVSKMPKWNAGSIKGKNVKTRFTLPITYMLD